MKVKFITTTSDLSKCFQLRRSLILNDWDFHLILHEWKGFGSKIIETYNFLKANPDITHFFYSDAWDTVALGTMDECLARIPDKEVILFSTERACYPHPEKASLYPENDSPWKYLNGGGWFASSALFCKMIEEKPLTYDTVDQVYFTDRFLDGYIRLDYDCSIFQTIAFSAETDFNVGIPFHNNVTGSDPVFIHGNGHTPIDNIYKILPGTMESLKEVVSIWRDTEETHKKINEGFTDLVNKNPELKAYRDWIEEKVFGFGERSFLWMWKILIDEVPNPKFLEIGVFRGQVLGLIRLLSNDAKITGLTPLTSAGGHWESDYEKDIELLHDTFKLKQPVIIKGLSTEADAIAKADAAGPYDIIYIDGGHDYETARHDVYYYSSFVKIGGYLVIDDCAHRYTLPDGYFKGIESVSKAVDELLPNAYYREVFNVMHNRIFKRVA